MKSKPKKILHVVGGMVRAGTETWLMHVLRNIDRENYQMDFLVHTDEPGDYDDEIKALGSCVIPCPYTASPLKYAQEFQRILREYGPYDVVHSHVHHFSGWVLRQAYVCHVPMRIAHSHNDKRIDEQNASIARYLYLRGMKFLINRYATHKLAVSKLAAESLFTENWQQDTRCQIVYCGIDFTPFELSGDGSAIKKDLGLPSDNFIIGHVGRFVEQKNHVFLVEIFDKIVKENPNIHLLLVGEGPLRPTIESKISDLGLASHVTFAGIRSDVPQIMRDVMNVFLFPSLWEGLPIVAMEAQAAGLPCIFSDSITQELSIVPENVYWLSLSSSSEHWANEVIKIVGSDIDFRQRSWSKVQESVFNITVSIENLKHIYG